MSLSWLKRKARLGSLLSSSGDEDEEGLALDRILHGQSVIGKTCMILLAPSSPSIMLIRLVSS
ncbi:hypothetical protein SERLA73DRAFT_188399 [Serpula lacrymans var. lacrymans S7.3]|uniref:Uncharacterized protein n=2 Tax=Serpula lacrymans var. lacrymans TaxID=341189 RepID=F8QB90_SERL3|nr:uncharacterized protein SERLADRAFT_478494 [Serpula lacrymans var. lacrymans S7.9]EGN94476.1 hypothetical protein SERLA73DRAFT_188399 [Serpula lacrymans var. lacrymans S7.3]EGO19955.1 hypothetical protein SERLADRAFT_478494 [Serpula lacrymans var. lacrymans S7.9]